jgi:hypothetical protein
LARNGFEATFLPKDQQQALVAKLDAYLATA